MVRIAIDAMGGDHAPGNVIDGMRLVGRSFGTEDQLVLVGREDVIRAEFERKDVCPDHVEIVHADEVVEMSESPVDALRKKPNSSIRKMISMLKAGEVDAVFSAGNTGAMVAASQLLLGLLPGVRRAGIAVTIPRGQNPVVLMDVGANVQCKPVHLYQYGVMATVVSSHLYGIEKPKVGMLNVGAEEQKGNSLVKETKELFRASESVAYMGNVEGGDIFHGDADVVICDGFVGNIVLKVSEGLSEFLMRSIGAAFEKEAQGMAGQATGTGEGFGEHVHDVYQQITRSFDYAEYGGAPLLGVKGTVLIGHGRSDGRAILNAALWAKKIVDTRINDHIVGAIADK